MDFFSKKARGITPYTAGEQPKDKRYVKLNTNENPYPPSPKAEEALRSFHADELNLYPSPDSDLLRRAVAEAEGTEPENVFCSNGSDEALYLAFAAFFDADGTGACFPDLTYSFYRVFAGIHGIPFTQVPLNGDFTMDLSRMRETDCQGYFIANPNAPTGAGIPLSEMEKFISSVPDRIVIADEAYMDFYGQSCAPLIRKYRNLLVIKTFSKSYSLAGIRCGYAIGDRALIEGLRRMKDCMNSYPVDRVCERVCAAALADREYHEKTTALVVSERERLRDELLRLGFTVPDSKANFLFAGRGKKSGGEIYRALKEEGVLVRFWDAPVLRDFCRITVGSRVQNDILIEKLKKILL